MVRIPTRNARLKNIIHPPDDSPDAAPTKTPRSPESLKNLRRGNLPSVRQQEVQDDPSDDCTNETGHDFSLLKSMRHVLRRPASQDKSQEQRELRKWIRTDRKGFMAKMVDLEKAQPRSASHNPGKDWDGNGPCPVCRREAEGVDEGSERALAALDRWRKEEGL